MMAMFRREQTLSTRKTPARPGRRPARNTVRRRELEVLETRALLTTFTVTNLHAAGAGSLRQAILQSNSHPGPDTIDFGVTGTIKAGRQSLPAITGTTTIDGTSAPGFHGSPVVTVNFNGTKGLRFAAGSDGSALESLALVRAGGAGVTLIGSNITVQGNNIGVLANGSTVAANRGDGIRIVAASHGDIIGQLDPVTSVSYYNTDSISMPVSGWQGIRSAGTPGQYLITGTSNTNGLLYVGPISGVGGTSYAVNYPNAYSTSVYGPDVVSGTGSSQVLRLVGSYRAVQGGPVQGFVFQGTTADLLNSADYKTIDYSGANYVYVHSTMGGNAGDIPAQTDHAFIYSVPQGQIVSTITYPGSQVTSTTAYGIWYNGGTSYTIAGGYTTLLSPGQTASEAYLVDYNASNGQFSNWTSFAGPEGLTGPSFATHFQGISSPVPGVYTLSADVTNPTSSTPLQATLTTVIRNPDGTFGPAYWVNLNYPGSTGLETADSVAGNQIVGLADLGSGGGIISYQATVNLGFRLSNVISGNRGNGIAIHGASGVRIGMNNIGTDASGTLARGNAKNGILLDDGASGNQIGGLAPVGGSTDSGSGSGNVGVRPPQGNLISGNRGNGVLITGGAAGNMMSGNFVGTNASGNASLGNRQNGVAVVHAGSNQVGNGMPMGNLISGNARSQVRTSAAVRLSGRGA
ncbi:MAG: hypothetical protein ACYC61_02630 [Isosphaeraceae bacterium]